MNSEQILPIWLDRVLFNTFAAEYERKEKTLNVIDMNTPELKKYLGTYYPRSYGESKSLIEDLWESNFCSTQKESIDILDFGCGSGGEIMGILDALKNKGIRKRVNITGYDGNAVHLAIFKSILERAAGQYPFAISCDLRMVNVKHEDEFKAIRRRLENDGKEFDLIVTFKALSEIMNKKLLKGKNPYLVFLDTFFDMLCEGGVCLMADICCRCTDNVRWFSDSFYKIDEAYSKYIVDGNQQYNYPIFTISHSRQTKDKSKIMWKMLQMC